MFDFCLRVERSKINKRTVDALIKAGAFDSIHPHRAALSASIDRAFDFATATLANANQSGLFDMEADAHGCSSQEPELVDVAPWGVKERLTHEKPALGFYLSGHLFDEVAREVRRFVRTRLADLRDTRDTQTVAGIVGGFRVVNGMRGKQGIFVLDDTSAQIEASANEAVLNQYRELLQDDELVIVSGRLQPGRNGFEARFIVQQVQNLPTARCRFGKYLQVAVGTGTPDIARVLAQHPSLVLDSPGQAEPQKYGLPVRLSIDCPDADSPATAQVQLGPAYQTYPSDEALAAWTQQAEQGHVTIVYE